MDQIFALGQKIWQVFEALLDPANFSQFADTLLPVGIVLIVLTALVLVVKNRRSKGVRRKQLEELEEALLDDSPEDKALNLPVSPPQEVYEEDYYDEEEDYREEKPIAKPTQSTLAQDPEFGKQIVITAQSSRKKSAPLEAEKEDPVKSPQDDSSGIDIEQELAQFAQDLKRKQLEVQQKHRQERDDLNQLEEMPEDTQPEVISLDATQIIEGEKTEPAIFSGDLDDLLVQPELESIPVEKEQEEFMETLLVESESTAPTESKTRNQQLILRLEEFQQSLEHRFQSENLSRLAQQNFELVESLNNSESAKNHQKSRQNQRHALSTLESLAFGSGDGHR